MNCDCMKQMISLTAYSLASVVKSSFNICALAHSSPSSHPHQAPQPILLKFCPSHHWAGSNSGKNTSHYSVHLPISLINCAQASNRFLWCFTRDSLPWIMVSGLCNRQLSHSRPYVSQTDRNSNLDGEIYKGRAKSGRFSFERSGSNGERMREVDERQTWVWTCFA